MTALLLVLFVPNYFGNEDVYYIPRTEVQACSWLSANSPDGAVFVQSVTGFPARCAGDYYEHVGSSRGDTPNLMSVDRKFANNDFSGNVPALTESVYQKVRSYGRNSRLIFSTSQERYARAWGLFGGEDGYRRLEAAVARLAALPAHLPELRHQDLCPGRVIGLAPSLIVQWRALSSH